MDVLVLFPKKSIVECNVGGEYLKKHCQLLFGKKWLYIYDFSTPCTPNRGCGISDESVSCVKGEYKIADTYRDIKISPGTVFLVKGVQTEDFARKEYWEQIYSCKFKLTSPIDVEELEKEKKELEEQIKRYTAKITSIDALIQHNKSEIDSFSKGYC